jgi:hypothetical protein
VAMVIAFANNLTLVCVHGTPTVVYTDWVPMGDADRVAAQTNVHSLFATGGTASLTYVAQTSNDGGQNPISTTLTAVLNATGVDQQAGATLGALVRFKYTLQLSGSSAGDIAAVCFDLHARIDHA